MSDPRSDAQLDRQQVELLPARTLLSTFARDTGGPPRGGPPNPIETLLSHVHILDFPGPNDGFVGSGGGGTGGV
ncbi:MAG TPA: hypothetical protein VJ757_05395 [Pseudonocardiaceae bacterium]|nr:hypothetical protein [Pseudonocardiaceae bacterium]